MRSLIVILLLMMSGSVMGQTPQYSIALGGTSNIFPFSTTANNQVQWLYTPSEFNAPSGTITRIYIKPSTATTNAVYSNLTIKMGHTNIAAFVTGAFNTGLNTVYYAATQPVTTSTGVWLAIDLQTPFSYDNTMNLIVEGSQTSYTGSGFSLSQDGTLANRRLYGSLSAGTGTAGTGMLDFGFDLITCNPPTSVTANNITVAAADLTWTPASVSQGYEYKLDQNPGNPTSAGTFTTGTSYSATNLSLNTTYYFHVRNICSGGPSQWVNYPFTTLDAYCRRPNQILFSNITGSSADVLWSQMPNTDYYEYYYDLTPYAPYVPSKGVVTSGITTHLSNLAPDNWYYFYVRSFCLNGGDSSIWKIDSFYTNALCTMPSVVIENIGTNIPKAIWNVIPNAVAYEYVVSGSMADPGFGAQVNDTFANITLPPDNKEKYLHVRTKCNSIFTFSQWSHHQLRTTNVENVSDKQNVVAFPNPVKDVLTIDVKDLTFINGIIHVTDVTGKILFSKVIDGSIVKMDLKHLASGLYLVNISSGNHHKIIKISKQQY